MKFHRNMAHTPSPPPQQHVHAHIQIQEGTHMAHTHPQLFLGFMNLKNTYGLCFSFSALCL